MEEEALETRPAPRVVKPNAVIVPDAEILPLESTLKNPSRAAVVPPTNKLVFTKTLEEALRIPATCSVEAIDEEALEIKPPVSVAKPLIIKVEEAFTAPVTVTAAKVAVPLTSTPPVKVVAPLTPIVPVISNCLVGATFPIPTWPEGAIKNSLDRAMREILGEASIPPDQACICTTTPDVPLALGTKYILRPSKMPPAKPLAPLLTKDMS